MCLTSLRLSFWSLAQARILGFFSILTVLFFVKIFFCSDIAVNGSCVSKTDDVLIGDSKNFSQSEGSLIFRPLIFSGKNQCL